MCSEIHIEPKRRVVSLDNAGRLFLAAVVTLGFTGGEADAQTKAGAAKSKKPVSKATLKSDPDVELTKKAAVPAATKKEAAAEGTSEMIDALTSAGYLTLEYNPETGSETAIRGPSISRPSGYRVMPVEITTEVKAHEKAQIILPCPRDIMDQRHAGCQVMVTLNGKPVPCESKIVYSEATESGFVNPFVLITNIKTKGSVTVYTRHWLVMPEYDPMPEDQMSRKLGPQASAHIGRAFDAANNLPYDPSIGGFDSAKARKMGKGDCGQKAVLAREVSAQGAGELQVSIDVLEGYSQRVPGVDSKFGGNHALNIVSTRQGLMTFDGRGIGGKYIGPQNGFIATSIGGTETIKGLPLAIHQWKEGTNLGLYFNMTPGRAHMSAPGFGTNGAALRQAQPSPEVAKYAAWLRAQNETKYQ